MARASSVFYIGILLYFSTILTYTEQNPNVDDVLHAIGEFIPSLKNTSRKICNIAIFPISNKFDSSEVEPFDSSHFCSNLTATVKAACQALIVSTCLLAPYPVLIPPCQYFLPKFLCR